MINDLDLLISLLPFAFAVHNIEEVLGMEKWSKSLPYFMHRPVSTRQFAVAVILFTALGFVLILSKKYFPSEEQYLYVVAGFSGMLLLNVFMPHLFASIYLKKYTPGVISGFLINLPLTINILWNIYRSNRNNTLQIFLSVVLGGISGLILAFIFLRIGKYIDGKIRSLVQ